jgi:hypothetical protein
MPATHKNFENTTLNLLGGTPEYKNKLTIPGQCKILQMHLKNLDYPYLFIIVATGQGLIFPRKENYEQSLTHSVYYMHCSFTKAFIINALTAEHYYTSPLKSFLL